MSYSSQASCAAHPKQAPREPTMPRFEPAQKRLPGVFLCKSGEIMVTRLL
jgi:hypothetical protein